MIVDLHDPSEPRCHNADDFKRFHCIAPRSVREAVLKDGFAFDGEHTWVPLSWLTELGKDRRREWHEGLAAMLAYADSKNWINHARRAVRAHVHWSSA